MHSLNRFWWGTNKLQIYIVFCLSPIEHLILFVYSLVCLRECARHRCPPRMDSSFFINFDDGQRSLCHLSILGLGLELADPEWSPRTLIVHRRSHVLAQNWKVKKIWRIWSNKSVSSDHIWPSRSKSKDKGRQKIIKKEAAMAKKKYIREVLTSPMTLILETEKKRCRNNPNKWWITEEKN